MCTPLWVYARFRPYGDVTALLLKRRVPRPYHPLMACCTPPLLDGGSGAAMPPHEQVQNGGGTCLATQWKVHVRCYGRVLLADSSAARLMLLKARTARKILANRANMVTHWAVSLLEPTINKYSHRWGCTRCLFSRRTVTTSHNYRFLGFNFSWRWLPRTTFLAEYSSELLGVL